MSRLLKLFPEMPLKLLALGTVADSDGLLQFPTPTQQAPSPGAANPPVRSRAPLADAAGWHHGGINE
jgi:hypothetical protein